MLRPQAIAILLALAGAACWGGMPPERFARAGAEALEHTRAAVELGPRPAGSQAQTRQQRMILERLALAGVSDIEQHDFRVGTPLGSKTMKNIIAKIPGRSDRVIALSGHYDTYARPELEFVGANDGGSSTGFLLAAAKLFVEEPAEDSIWIVFFDGEESTVAWQDGDHTYGSRELAARWAVDGTKERLRALINVDMIGDRDLSLVYEGGSTPWLRELIWNTADRLGYGESFPRKMGYVADDHIPFIERGMPAVDLIDFDYGLMNRFWHSEQDTIDKLDARSFAVLLHVVVEAVRELDK